MKINTRVRAGARSGCNPPPRPIPVPEIPINQV